MMSFDGWGTPKPKCKRTDGPLGASSSTFHGHDMKIKHQLERKSGSCSIRKVRPKKQLLKGRRKKAEVAAPGRGVGATVQAAGEGRTAPGAWRGSRLNKHCQVSLGQPCMNLGERKFLQPP